MVAMGFMYIGLVDLRIRIQMNDTELVGNVLIEITILSGHYLVTNV
jgi:hypothetical protein